MNKLQDQKTTVFKTNELVGFEFAKDACRKYVLFCDDHQSYMFGQYKKELLSLSVLEFCMDCKDLEKTN